MEGFVFLPLRFPIWWYTTGLVAAFGLAERSVIGYARMLAITVWIKNIFVPMFGQHDWQSRLISVFMRTAQIVARSVFLLAVVFIAAAALLVYVAALPLAVLGLLINVVGSLG